MAMFSLKVEEFPVIETGYLICPTPCEYLKKNIEIYDRFCSAIYMATKISTSKPQLYILSTIAGANAHLRACLAELVSIEDYIAEIYPDLDEKKYKIYELSNPLLSLLKILRNFNIHLKGCRLKSESINVKTLIEPDKSYDFDVYFIDNLDIEALTNVRSAKSFLKNELSGAINRFIEEQSKFGVSNLLIRGILMYSDIIGSLLQDKVSRE